ncbi:MAG TPA: hypothetical protein VMG99_09125 [Thermoplasmata archaeon]|nr:hypothetical protein [Thermoplasmata archaeon]
MKALTLLLAGVAAVAAAGVGIYYVRQGTLTANVDRGMTGLEPSPDTCCPQGYSASPAEMVLGRRPEQLIYAPRRLTRTPVAAPLGYVPGTRVYAPRGFVRTPVATSATMRRC